VVPARQRTAELTQRVHDLQLAHTKLQQEIEQRTQRSDRLDQDLAELASQSEALQAQRDESEQTFSQLDEQLAEQQGAFAEAEMRGESLADQAQQIREQVRERERAEQEGVFARRGTEARIAELERNRQLALDQQARAASEFEGLVTELVALDAQTPQNGLQEALALRMEKEAVLGRLRTEMDTLAAQLREAEEARLVLERSLQPQRDAITELQLQEQAARYRLSNLVNSSKSSPLTERPWPRRLRISRLRIGGKDWLVAR